MEVGYVKVSWSWGPCQLDILDSCESDHIQFYLFTSNSSSNPTRIYPWDKSPPKAFDAKAKTKILIHGYAGHLEFNGTALVREAYLQSGRYNIIVVDWGRLVRLPCYPLAVLNTWQAGKCTAELITRLVKLKTRGFRISRLHIIGFSLGAHVAAFTANNIYKRYEKKVKRITGLDPALPFFASVKTPWKLDKDDAKFVDIIHTNSGVFGKLEATGHVDFYVNGGTKQPACRMAHNPSLCSHVISTVYYAESVLTSKAKGNKKFRGVQCPSYLEMAVGHCRSGQGRSAIMGDPCKHKTRGIFYVETEMHPPFAKG